MTKVFILFGLIAVGLCFLGFAAWQFVWKKLMEKNIDILNERKLEELRELRFYENELKSGNPISDIDDSRRRLLTAKYKNLS